MRVLVCGGRRYADKDAVWRELDALHKVAVPDCMLVIQGGATGADAHARSWCEDRFVDYKNFPARWYDIHAKGAVIKTNRFGRKYNAAAGPERNQRMLAVGKPDLVLAFPGGDGTADMKDRAKAAGVEVREIA